MPRVTIDPSGDLVLRIPIHPPQNEGSFPKQQADTRKSDVQRENIANGATVKVEKTDTEGSLVTTTQELVVSSTTLSTASSAFRALFDGQGLDRHSVLLPNDDVEAMTLLCRLLHFRFAEIPDRPATQLLEKLALTCNKYDCVPTLKYCGGIWVRNWITHYKEVAPNMDDLCRLFVFVYIADLALEFAEIAWKILLYHRGQFRNSLQVATLRNHTLLPIDLATRLDAMRKKLCKDYYIAMMAPFTTWSWGSLNHACFRAQRPIAQYIAALRNAGILSQDPCFSGHDFWSLLQAARELPHCAVGPCLKPKNMRGSEVACGCSQDRTENLASELQAAVRKIQSQYVWFGCLDCLKTRNVSKAGGTCRVTHD